MAPAEALLTIRARGRQRSAELQTYETRSPLPPSITDRLRTHFYTPPRIPDRLSNLPVGRHRPEYIRDEGRVPLFMHTVMTEPAPEPLPTRVPKATLDPLDLLSPYGETSQSSLRPLPRRSDYAALTRQLAERLRQPYQLPLLTQIGGSPLEAAGMLGGISKSSSPSPEPTSPTTLRSATEQGIHAKKGSRLGRRLVAAAAAVTTGLALVGGFQFLKDKTPAPTSLRGNSVVVTLPNISNPVESPPTPPVNLTESGIISEQDRNGWGHSANITQAALNRDYALNGVTNIVAKVGAYDSRLSSPDPDAASPGDTMITLSIPAIQLVDRLQQPLGLDASQAEKDAAQIIYQLNSLGPMGTQTFIQNYGNEIHALKTHLITILTVQEQQASSQASQSIEVAQTSPISDTEASGKATTVFALTLTAAQAKSLERGRKAIAGLAADHHRRQRLPSFA